MGTPPKSKGGKQKSVKPKLPPFRLSCPPEVAQPKKAAWLPHALKFLEPFQFQTDAEALAAGAEFVDGKTRFPISAESAARLVVGIASRFNTETYFEARAPRLNDIYSELSELSKAITKLSATLHSLNDVTLHELRSREDTAVFYNDRVVSNMDVALTKELPRPANETSPPESHNWQDRLAALSRHVEFTRRRFQHEREQQGRSPGDKGGRTNMFKGAVGPPKWGLVIDCLSVFDAFKPGQATGYGEGPFHNFVSEIFEFATGIKSENAAVADWVKKLVPVHRKLQKLQPEIQRIHAQIKQGEEQRAFDTAAGQKRWVELMRKLRHLQDQETELAQEYWPHLRLSKL